MKTNKVKKLKPLQRFLYWIKERHQIHLRRLEGMEKPWTDDEVLQNYFFTNPYRENDKVTIWFRENIREPLRDSDDVLFATVLFRWFNKPDPTGVAIVKHCLHLKWNKAIAKRVIGKLSERGPVFTGAYMIKAGNGPPGCKVPNVCDAVTNVWRERDRLVQLCKDDCRLQALNKELAKFPHLGGFMAYEIVCDLRYTALLENATDINEWANPGPGCWRGLARLQELKGRPNKKGKMIFPKVEDPIGEMQKLRVIVNKRLKPHVPFEMREVEHSLCEFDKYDRMLFQEGKSKRKYNGS